MQYSFVMFAQRGRLESLISAVDRAKWSEVA